MIIGLFAVSCNRQNQVSKEVKKALGKNLYLDMYDQVRCGNKSIPFKEFRRSYDYLYLVFLEDNCKPCIPKYIDWHEQMNKMNKQDNFTVLFIIQALKYEYFIDAVKSVKDIDDDYFSVMDLHYAFFTENSKISRWILNKAILIDAENKILMIGAPFASNKMKQMFYNIIQMDKKIE